ncbi:DNA polymerase I [Salmonella enterica subsp. enterica]|uniref:DNA polymerase I n=1 Tax=Salmonella enterica I TaxID=59201 RepID=A0A379X595_SALET|nr:DNA polymerase I [Salmonella enterica subsp. enterica]
MTLESWIEKLKKAPVFAFDTETTAWIISPPTWWASRLPSNLALPRMYLSRMIIWTLRIKFPASVLWNC